jgi:hypothetical protein
MAAAAPAEGSEHMPIAQPVSANDAVVTFIVCNAAEVDGKAVYAVELFTKFKHFAKTNRWTQFTPAYAGFVKRLVSIYEARKSIRRDGVVLEFERFDPE